LIDKFWEKTKANIELAMTNSLKEWSEQVTELQVLRADKANWEPRGLGFWKLYKANCEAVHHNLITDFVRIALKHRGEITKLLVFIKTLFEACARR
jgi:hypothetical protein